MNPISVCPGAGATLEFPVPPVTGTEKITQIMQGVLEAKNAMYQEKKGNIWERYNPILIGGDLFSLGYLTFQGALSLVPKLQVGLATLVCGEIAGVINIGVGLVSLKEGLQALKNGDHRGGVRLLLDFACFMAIGAIMILNSSAIKIIALGSVAAFFAAN